MKYLPLALLCILASVACKNDLEINAPWIETPVVYGFIDAYQDTQYIRIEKTYQNSANVSTQAGAQYADSLYFDSLIVRVLGSDGRIDTFNKVALPKQPGVFENGTHYVYRRAGFKPGIGGINNTYTLQIFNPKSGNTYTSAATQLVDSARFGSSGNFVSVIPTDPSGKNGNLRYSTTVSAKARIYDFFIRFNYQEVDLSGHVSNKFLDFMIEGNFKPDLLSPTYVRVIDGAAYMSYLNTNLPANPQVDYRQYQNIQFFASGGSDALVDITDLSQPSTTITPKNTQYSNITGALGIFSSLSVHYIYPKVKDPTVFNTLPQFKP